MSPWFTGGEDFGPLEINGLIVVRISLTGNNHLLVFGADQDIERQAAPRFWVMDGTFKTSPNLFYQVYTIHGFVGEMNYGQTFPAVYCMMTGKTTEIYKEMLRVSPCL